MGLVVHDGGGSYIAIQYCPWCGAKLDEGRSQDMKPLTNPQMDDLEKSIGVVLPGLYRKLLLMIGYGTTDSGKQLYHPLEIRPLYAPFFDDESQLFHPYFPFGCSNHSQEIWVIDVNRELAASIWHETVPDDWPEESWLDYAEWILKYIPLLDSECGNHA
jgi:hypothetical protein